MRIDWDLTFLAITLYKYWLLESHLSDYFSFNKVSSHWQHPNNGCIISLRLVQNMTLYFWHSFFIYIEEFHKKALLFISQPFACRQVQFTQKNSWCALVHCKHNPYWGSSPIDTTLLLWTVMMFHSALVSDVTSCSGFILYTRPTWVMSHRTSLYKCEMMVKDPNQALGVDKCLTDPCSCFMDAILEILAIFYYFAIDCDNLTALPKVHWPFSSVGN